MEVVALPSFVAVACSIGRTCHSLLGPARGWKAYIAADVSTDREALRLMTDTADVVRELDIRVTTDSLTHGEQRRRLYNHALAHSRTHLTLSAA